MGEDQRKVSFGFLRSLRETFFAKFKLRVLRINRSKLFAAGKNHINGIENFWNQAQPNLRKFNGVPQKHFPPLLKECQWHFNHPNPKTQLRQLNQWANQFLT